MLSLLLVPSCIYSFWHSVIPTSYFILSRFNLDCRARRDVYTYSVHLRACVLCTRIKNGSCDVYVQSTIKWRRSKRKSPRWTWILLSEGQILPYYTTDTSRTKIRPSHVKIIVFKPFYTEEEEEEKEEEEEEEEKMDGLAAFRIYL